MALHAASRRNPDLGSVRSAGLPDRTRPGFDRWGERHNSLGFKRTADLERSKPAGTIRIFFLGGSAAYGTGGLYPEIQTEFAVIRNDQTIDHSLEEELTRMFPGVRFEVVNAAVVGYCTYHHVLNFLAHVQALDPDVIVCMDGHNDFFPADSRDDNPYANPGYGSAWTSPITDPDPLEAAVVFLRWLGRFSLLFRKVSQRVMQWAWLRQSRPFTVEDLASRRGLVSELADADFRREVRRVSERTWVRAWRQLALLSRDQGVDLVLSFQPMLILRDRATLTPIEQRLWDHTRDLLLSTHAKGIGLSPERMRAAYEVVKESMESLRSCGAALVDMHAQTERLRGAQLFSDYCHITPQGGRSIAQVYARSLRPIVLRRIRDRRTP